MKQIEKGIVFSNDMNLIINGSNALDYNYDKEKPNSSFIESLRNNFLYTTKKIFENVTIITEEEMSYTLNYLANKFLRVCPHCNFR